jgi:hypothetical protein
MTKEEKTQKEENAKDAPKKTGDAKKEEEKKN